MSTLEQLETKLESTVDSEARIVLFNDDKISFDHVIECLVLWCGHTLQQAEQCATIVHNKGKYPVKHGELETLMWINNMLSINRLTTEIQV